MTNDIEKGWEGHALSSGEDFQQWNVEACFAISIRFKGEGGGVENETYVLRFASFCELLRRPLIPIVFGINLIHFFDGKNYRTGQNLII